MSSLHRIDKPRSGSGSQSSATGEHGEDKAEKQDTASGEKTEPAAEDAEDNQETDDNAIRRQLSRLSIWSSRRSHRRDAEFQVEFNEGDPANPKNWSSTYKALVTLQLGFLALVGSIGSSIISPAGPVLAEYLGVSEEVTILTVALYVLGFAFGPMFWAPISEVYGRKWSILPAIGVLSLFSIGTAVSTSAASVFITRFFGGVFGSAPISNVSAALGDMYEPQARGMAMTFYAIMVVGGPTLGPVVGSSIVVTLGWRWTEYIEAIFAAFMVLLTYFFLPELYAPVILKRKAATMRKDNNEQRFWHPHEDERISPTNAVSKYFSRPLRMLITEPMVTCIAFYASFVYGVMYAMLAFMPIVFQEERGYGTVVSTLPFLGLFVGVLCAVGINLANQSYYAKAMAKNKGRAVPEARLPPMLVGGILLSAGMFWFGWTASPQYHWSLPTVAAGFIGGGFNTIFQQCLNYLVDSYGLYAASATSANTILRSLIACGLPLAARPMVDALGIARASTVLAGISCLGLPVPFVFRHIGERLRKRSNFAPVQDD